MKKLNVVQGVGKLYWIYRDTAKENTPKVCKAFMHEIGGYWRKGKGIQFKYKKYIFQIGICKKYPTDSEEQGLLSVVNGRNLDYDPTEIGTW
jgi:hypothetical protein